MHLDYTITNFNKLQFVTIVFEYVLLKHYTHSF